MVDPVRGGRRDACFSFFQPLVRMRKPEGPVNRQGHYSLLLSSTDGVPMAGKNEASGASSPFEAREKSDELERVRPGMPGRRRGER